MHPAPSLIFFSVFSGLGFGLLAWLGIGYAAPTGGAAFGLYFLAFAAAGGGLLAAGFHLANPKNAIRSFSQWRTSWLSREAWFSIAALLVMAICALMAIFADSSAGVLGWVGAALSLGTVYATSMIYAQLKTVPRWNSAGTSLLFAVMAIAGGSIIADAGAVAALLVIVAGGLQLWVWKTGDQKALGGSSLKTATGLGKDGAVRLFEPPHTGTNYLLDEMVYRIGRKHAQKLRFLSITLMSALPALFLLSLPGIAGATLALVSHLTGALAARWLFFAEAEHVVGLYYGK